MVNVLLVDDDADNQLLVQTWLERLGHQVTAADSASQAFATLAVLDIVMPGLDGMQFLKQLRQIPDYADMPAIFLTAADLDPQPDRDGAPPATYLPKPLTRAMLTAALTDSPNPGPSWRAAF